MLVYLLFGMFTCLCIEASAAHAEPQRSIVAFSVVRVRRHTTPTEVYVRERFARCCLLRTHLLNYNHGHHQASCRRDEEAFWSSESHRELSFEPNATGGSKRESCPGIHGSKYHLSLSSGYKLIYCMFYRLPTLQQKTRARHLSPISAHRATLFWRPAHSLRLTQRKNTRKFIPM